MPVILSLSSPGGSRTPRGAIRCVTGVRSRPLGRVDPFGDPVDPLRPAKGPRQAAARGGSLVAAGSVATTDLSAPSCPLPAMPHHSTLPPPARRRERTRTDADGRGRTRAGEDGGHPLAEHCLLRSEGAGRRRNGRRLTTVRQPIGQRGPTVRLAGVADPSRPPVSWAASPAAPPAVLPAPPAGGHQPRRQANNRVAATSHQQRPGWSGGVVPAVSAPTQPRDEPGKRAAKTSG